MSIQGRSYRSFLFLLSVLAACPALALDPPPALDPLGLGMGAASAVASGSSAVPLNPSGAARATVPTVRAVLGLLPEGESLHFGASGLLPLANGTVFGLSQYSTFPSGSGSSTVYMGTVGLPLDSSRDLLLGLNLKYFALSLGAGPSAGEGRGWGFDLGFSYDVRRPEGVLASFAAVIRDPFTQLRTDSHQEIPLTRSFLLGAAYRGIPETKIAVEAEVNDARGHASTRGERFRVGGERFFPEQGLSARVGMESDLQDDHRVGAGVVYRPKIPLEFEYAAQYGLQAGNLTHLLSGTYWFDPAARPKGLERVERSAEPAILLSDAPPPAPVTPTFTPFPFAALTQTPSPTLTPLTLAAWTRTPSPTSTGTPTPADTRVPLASPVITLSTTRTFTPDSTPTTTPTDTQIPILSPARTHSIAHTPTRTPSPTFTPFTLATWTRTPSPTSTPFTLSTFTQTPSPTSTAPVPEPTVPTQDGKAGTARTAFVLRSTFPYISRRPGDRTRGTVTFTLPAPGPGPSRSWRFEVTDGSDSIVHTQAGEKDAPVSLTWDGKDGKGQALPEGAYSCRLLVRTPDGTSLASNSLKVTLDDTDPILSLTADGFLLDPATPRPLLFRPSFRDASGIQYWKLDITGDSGSIFRTLRGTGDPPAELAWDGKNAKNEPAPAGSMLRAAWTGLDRAGNTATSPTLSLQVDFIPSTEGGQMTLNLATVPFAEGSSTIAAADLEALDRAAASIRPYVAKSVLVIKGYASPGESDDPVRLSQERALAVRGALAKILSIPLEAVAAVGYSTGTASAGTAVSPESGRRAIVSLTTKP